ncbi:DUF4251 domain-containing protein [Parabacteroides sp. AM08-6]|uniref:DUF4251 domain-containing protein n=1 Tax=Parabacteroides sp. AM08-6 TaxID=2292053 RepID=UPI000EFEC013|nr:DUF4251 domain-containing protein [Parabacteroides sp. AM08-6]RHJ77798.1 DUF4251 domain-containing protein [Parabacteroides sp. AM08-6]
MMNIRLFFLIGVVLLIGGQSLFAQSKQEKKEQKEKEVKEMIDKKRFTIDVNRALPMRGRSVNLTSPYSLEMRGDSAISYLPYYGRAYSAPFGGGNGLRFEKSITDYTCSYNKKGMAQIKFVARTNDDVYRFHVEVYPNGSANINVTPINKQSITFRGELASPKDDKE